MGKMSKFVLICCQEIVVKIMKKYDKNIRFISINMESASHILDLIAPDIDFVCMLLSLSICLSFFLLFFIILYSFHFTVHQMGWGGVCLFGVSDDFLTEYISTTLFLRSDRGGGRELIFRIEGILDLLDSNQ